MKPASSRGTRRNMLMLFMLVVTSCGDSLRPDVAVAARRVTAVRTSVRIGEAQELAVECLNARWRTVAGHRVQWFADWQVSYLSVDPQRPPPKYVLTPRGSRATFQPLEQGWMEVWAVCERRDLATIEHWDWDRLTVVRFLVAQLDSAALRRE